MISSHERADIIHIMKMQRFMLTNTDSAHLEFSDQRIVHKFVISILAVENEPEIKIVKHGREVFSDRLKSVDDLKIFLEEKLYQYLG